MQLRCSFLWVVYIIKLSKYLFQDPIPQFKIGFLHVIDSDFLNSILTQKTDPQWWWCVAVHHKAERRFYHRLAHRKNCLKRCVFERFIQIMMSLLNRLWDGCWFVSVCIVIKKSIHKKICVIQKLVIGKRHCCRVL